MHSRIHRAVSLLAAGALSVFPAMSAFAADEPDFSTKTPIKHVVVIFQENVSFDHYFATYPHATNPGAEPQFHAKDDTPRVNNLLAAGLLTENPNSTQPFRLDRSQAVTCDQDHNYGDEQKSFNRGLMDKFPEFVGTGNSTSFPCVDAGKGKGLVMGYYDGNTVTAFWNYAQHFAMSDNSFSTGFGPSTPGAINLISGNTAGATLTPFAADGKTPGSSAGNIAGGLNSGAVIGDPRPEFDDCVSTPVVGTAKKTRIRMSGKNVGELLNAKNITWGWFQGGFGATTRLADGTAVCAGVTSSLAGPTSDYIPHHEPFMYYQLSANQHHLPPSSAAAIGKTDQAKHQYDLDDFYTALSKGKLPAVSFIKAKGAQDGHAGYSSPLDEQKFVVGLINLLMQNNEWNETAVIIAYDDSDGWYDHQMGPIVMQSDVSDDQLVAPGSCGVTAAGGTPGRCGYGPRMPLLVISPYAKQNYVDHRVTDQASILRFIEDNWGLERIGNGSLDEKAGTLNGLFDFDEGGKAGKLILDPATGLPH
ncbi:MAG TPA: alkaline phosphatase family protein [Candidatus Acidoferrum sp.]|nr:alkaline phosphatase family protein [Candidatus Acidoferrum sp.]